MRIKRLNSVNEPKVIESLIQDVIFCDILKQARLIDTKDNCDKHVHHE